MAAPPILIVEDDDLLREAVANALVQSGCGPLVGVRNGIEAVQALAHDPLPRLIILDLSMPVMSGRELLDQLRLLGPAVAAIPRVVLTGSSHPVLPEDIPVLQKPFALEELIAVAQPAAQ